MPSHKKGHDKDKYYHLAKDQGYRSRAAFKLIQINKRFDFLAKARVCVDLCAAPGGWCQVAAKYMPAGSMVLGIDLLPIRAIRNVKTLVSDITTAECRRLVTSELNGWKADVVLCDGAPNIGAAYDKDAYVQNELVLAALKTATDHLAEGGTFCTKVYRSRDYNSLIWVFQQLFEDVQAIKPNSSRSQSSEIFIVCLKYTNPSRIDPKLLDPNHVFKEVADPGLATVDVLHKKYDKLNKRHRTGYQDGVGVLLTSVVSVSDFIQTKDPVRMLTDFNECHFSTEECEQFRASKYTTPEILECLKDLRVLGKIDFKKLLKWRNHMRDMAGLGQAKAKSEEDMEEVEKDKRKRKGDIDETDESIQEEIMKLRMSALERDKREKKKARLNASKERQRQALGMTNNAFGEATDMELFSLPTSMSAKQHSKIEEVDLGDEEMDLLDDDDEDSETVGGMSRGGVIFGEDELEDELESAYLRFVSGRKKSAKERADDEKRSTKGELEDRPLTSKRARLAETSRAILSHQNEEDVLASRRKDNSAAIRGDLQAYVKMLAGDKGDESDSDDESEDDEFHDSAGGEDEDDEDEDRDGYDYDYDDHDEAGSRETKRQKLVTSDRAPKQSRSDQWFSHPLFQESVVKSSTKELRHERLSEEASRALAAMPKTDREARKEKRKKEAERQQRREVRKAAKSDREASSMDIQILPLSKSRVLDDVDEDGVKVDEETRLKRDLIKKGMGKSADKANNDDSFTVAPAGPMGGEQYPARVDPRTYDSDEEQYDANDRAKTLALATLMLRKSRQKALVDASYNRFAWNDPNELPSWFLDDEMRHNKPQLPLPAALVEKVRSPTHSPVFSQCPFP
jgi:AdoMet-dependent rRNA methyltransferase SPB1